VNPPRRSGQTCPITKSFFKHEEGGTSEVTEDVGIRITCAYILNNFKQLTTSIPFCLEQKVLPSYLKEEFPNQIGLGERGMFEKFAKFVV
jgi:hypothetical protein